MCIYIYTYIHIYIYTFYFKINYLTLCIFILSINYFPIIKTRDMITIIQAFYIIKVDKAFLSLLFFKIKKNALFTLLHNPSVCQISEQWEVWIFFFTVKLLTWGNVISSGDSNGILNKNLKLPRDVVSLN